MAVTPGAKPHDRAVYLVGPPAPSVVTRAAATLPAPLPAIRDLPPDAMLW